MKSKEVRQQFIEFFRERGHTVVPSAPVIPHGDPTILFTNAGMNQFKPIFLGQQKPDFLRAVDTQKCIRVSGKHNDLEEVGVSPYHHTFFEMLGNWSFGDYFKKESIVWAWDLITNVYKLPKDKLYASVYETDEEAENLWKNETDILPSHVLRFGKKDNFWSMGDTGPCGPCTEIHIDRGVEFDSDPKAFVNSGSRRYIELWNLVFIQYDAQKDGSLIPLPAKHVDTGAGLERITNVLSGVKSNYDTDLFQPIIKHIVDMSGKEYSSEASGVPHRVIADHLRCLSFAIADGAMPGNEGRGYVLRRILRRAARFGRKLDMHEPFIYKLIPTLIDLMGEQFPEIKEKHLHVSSVIKAEEEHFGKTLDRGLEAYAKAASRSRANKSNIISGEDAFMLHDTFGFPLDLTQLMAREDNFEVDEAGFNKAMDEQKVRARSAGKFKNHKADQNLHVEWDGTFTGYKKLNNNTIILIQRPIITENVFLILAKETPFYSESGGQVADKGLITVSKNEFKRLIQLNAEDQYIENLKRDLNLLPKKIKLKVINVTKQGKNIIHTTTFYEPDHFGEELLNYLNLTTVVSSQMLKALLEVDPAHRIPTQYNHTATHLLQAALRETLGEHVHQAGSLVEPNYLRFDYTHFQKPTHEELTQIEARVNEHIRQNYPVNAKTTSLKEAQAMGAMALFGEKYGDEVRMIEIGENNHIVSRELCGGCHVKRTGDIGIFVIRSETSAAAGVRRIEALTGEKALRYLTNQRDKINDFVVELGSEGSDPLDKLRKFMDERKKLEKEIEQLRGKLAGSAMQELATKAVSLGNYKLVAAEVESQNMDQLKEMGDALREELKSGVGILVSAFDGKPSMVVVVTPDLVKSGVDAVPIVKELGKRLQGGGGGKPHIATAGGKNLAGIKDVIADAQAVVSGFLKV